MSATWLDHGVRHLLRGFGYRSDWVTTPAGPVHVLDRAGSGALPPVVLVHGFGASAVSWVPLVRALRGSVSRVTCVDLPGHGFSFRPPALDEELLKTSLLAALDQVHTAPAIVVGNSLGGAAAVRYANARPDRVLGTVLLSPAGAPMSSDELDAVQRLFAVTTRDEARTFFARLLAREPGSFAGWLLGGRLLQLLRDPVLQGFLRGVGHDQFLTPAELAALPGRTTVVWGRQDRILPATALDWWRAHLPTGSEVVQPDGLGHSPHFDDAAATAAFVLALAKQV